MPIKIPSLPHTREFNCASVCSVSVLKRRSCYCSLYSLCYNHGFSVLTKGEALTRESAASGKVSKDRVHHKATHCFRPLHTHTHTHTHTHSLTHTCRSPRSDIRQVCWLSSPIDLPLSTCSLTCVVIGQCGQCSLFCLIGAHWMDPIYYSVEPCHCTQLLHNLPFGRWANNKNKCDQ